MVKRVGVIGGGQLAWMMAAEAAKLDLELMVQTPSLDDPAVARLLGTHFVVQGAVDDVGATAEMASSCDVITFENEFVDLKALGHLAKLGHRFYPTLKSLKPLLDKYEQRQFLQEIGLPVPGFADLSAVGAALTHWENGDAVEFPVVVKTRRNGYDGQGTFVVRSPETLQEICEKLAHQPLLVEEFVPFVKELAAIATRSVSGDVAVYPIVETQQEDQVCRRVIAPAEISATARDRSMAIAQTLLEKLEGVGTYGIELFLTADDRVLVNEVAPRTHNSGHFTIETCVASQFEQHLRAVADLPLAPAKMTVPAAIMVNLLGFESVDFESTQPDSLKGGYGDRLNKICALPYTQVHWYGKMASRPGRKLAHVTLWAMESEEVPTLGDRAKQIEKIWYES
ncbi:MAG: 5-(carboxyamino)imidazole ribonucleotide synthase [Cyanobacteria bacterium P01_C01_bin.89]